MTVCFVGDVDVDEVREFAEKYFAGVGDAPDPPPVTTAEPVHTAERRVIAEEEANPVVLIGWQSPASADPDYAGAELLMEILGGGRSSRLYTRLVKDEQVATQVMTGTDLPGRKYPNQAGVFAFCAADRDPQEAEELIYEEIDRLIAEGPTHEEVQKVKAGYMARMLRHLRDPANLAVELASADQLEGDWRFLFRHLGRIEKVDATQIQALAAERLVKARRTVAVMRKPDASDEAES